MKTCSVFVGPTGVEYILDEGGSKLIVRAYELLKVASGDHDKALILLSLDTGKDITVLFEYLYIAEAMFRDQPIIMDRWTRVAEYSPLV